MGSPEEGASILGSVAHQGTYSARAAAGGFAAAVPLGMKLNHLRYVLSAAEEGSFRRAAASLNIQQSTISRRVRELEDRLGTTLFKREAGGVRLTRAGRAFLARAREAVTHLAEAADVAGAAARIERGVLRIGLVQPPGRGALSDLLRRLVGSHVPASFALTEGSPDQLLAAVALRQIDLAIVPDGVEAHGLLTAPLWREALLAVMRTDHPGAGKARLTWRDLAATPLLVPDGAIGLAIGRSRRDTAPSNPAASASAATVLDLAALGQGIAVLPASQAGRLGADLVARPISRGDLGFRAAWSPRNDKLVLRRALRLASEVTADPAGRWSAGRG